MKYLFTIFVIVLFGILKLSSEEKEFNKGKIIIHIAGEVEKPGKVLCDPVLTEKELLNSIGDLSKWASPRRITIIRFFREEGLKKSDKPVEDSFLKIDDVTNKEGNLILKEGDIIYVPMVRYMGK